ncbi:hypothetical protein EL17_11695 [Anditalea andensis]|uniref:Uncharacterized protein n=1 Tax=Anditalea andensis TaxID=1048983 RepID=A0A074KUB0_9BACT|nr:hypothetical protein EL17_11695 [Anditalea andensis]
MIHPSFVYSDIVKVVNNDRLHQADIESKKSALGDDKAASVMINAIFNRNSEYVLLIVGSAIF